MMPVFLGAGRLDSIAGRLDPRKESVWSRNRGLSYAMDAEDVFLIGFALFRDARSLRIVGFVRFFV